MASELHEKSPVQLFESVLGKNTFEFGFNIKKTCGVLGLSLKALIQET